MKTYLSSVEYLSIWFRWHSCIVRLLMKLPQLVLNSVARAVIKTLKFHHITLIPESLHWLKINERIVYKVLSQNWSTFLSPLSSLIIFASFSVWYTLSTSRCSTRHSFTYIKFACLRIFQPLCLKKLKSLLCHCSFPPYFLYSPRLSRDWYLRYLPSFVISSPTRFAIIHPHFSYANYIFI